jgi:hypothetical protein
VDLSPVTPPPNSPPNLHFIQGDVRALAKSGGADESPFQPASFDYIFSRLLIMGTTHWRAHIAALASLLVPDGWLELHELDVEAQYPARPGGGVGWSEPSFWKAIVAGFESKGLDAMAGRHLSGYMRDTASLTEVDEKQYRWPFHKDGNSAAERRMGMYSYAIYVPFLLGMLERLSPLSAEAREAMEADAMAHKQAIEPGMYLGFYTAWARKAGM